MPLSSSATSAAILAARAANKPVGIAIPRSDVTYHAQEWNNDTGVFSETDRVNSSYPTRYAVDGVTSTSVVTKPTSASISGKTYMYFLMSNSQLWTFDYIGIVGHNFGYCFGGLDASIQIQISDSSSFSSPLTLGTWTHSGGHTWRISLKALDHTGGTGRLYSDVQYLRIKVYHASQVFTEVPYFSEVILGRQRHFMRNPADPYDIEGRVSDMGEDLDTTRLPIRYAHSRGRYYRDTQIHLLDDTDRTTLRDLYADCEYGTRPVVWIDRPGTHYHIAPVCMLAGTRENYLGPNDSLAPIVLEETSPYVSGEY